LFAGAMCDDVDVVEGDYMGTGYLPTTDAGLLAWSSAFSELITAAPTDYGLVAGDATVYAALHASYADAFAVAMNGSTRTSGTIAAKNTARTDLKDKARELVAIIQATPSVTDEQKQDLKITVRKTEPTPVPPPATAPDVDVMEVSGRTVRIRLHDSSTLGHRGRPAGTQGAIIYSAVGASAPENIDDWKNEGITGQLLSDITFPDSVAGGSMIWITAQWFNGRKQAGPAADPVSTFLPGGLTAEAA
jgi:hypothetical protein